ncbi:MAG: protein kinase [Candidatus Hadarchaeum sp.]
MNCPICGAPISSGVTNCPRCGVQLIEDTSAFSPLALPVNTALQKGKYTIMKVLGQGGFGITYLGQDTILSRPVAIKELFPSGAQRKNKSVIYPNPLEFTQICQRFLEEAKIVAQFQHPGIVKVYDFFEENGTAYIVTEYLNGKSLNQIVQERGPLSEQEALKYIQKICEALEVVHAAHYLHRDIKPENIIVCTDGRIVLIDFGAARQFITGKTRKHTIILTPGYAPPEQYTEHAKRGPYTDIYALSATLFFLVTGETPPDALARLQGVSLPSVKTYNPQLSDQLEQAIERGMALKVQDRPQTVREFLAILQYGRTTSANLASVSSTKGIPTAGRTTLTKPKAQKLRLCLETSAFCGGASVGALLGMTGKWGATITYSTFLVFATLDAKRQATVAGTSLWNWITNNLRSHSKRNFIITIIVFALTLLFICQIFPIVGGIISGILAALFFMRAILEKKLFIIQCGCIQTSIEPQYMLSAAVGIAFILFILTIIASVTSVWIGLIMLFLFAILVAFLWKRFRL